MDLSVLIFLSSGLFLGWSLGANDAANVFGTAVGSRMVRFSTAALLCSVFVILGSTLSGAGAAHTLGQLGGINAIAGSFVAALSAALTVAWMTKLGLPVSTSQAIVGAIIGWNLFSGSATDVNALSKILGTWVACPVLAAVFAVLIYGPTRKFLGVAKLHILRLDAYTRWGLILAGALGSYSLGANNIANVMGVFVRSSPFTDFSVGHLFTLTSVQQLFLVGAIAIAVGVYTYSKNVMLTVGGGILPLSPVGSWVVVVAQSIVLILFASVGLEHFLASYGLPTIPLVPVSSSQAVVGAVIGIGLLQRASNIRWSVVGRISVGWVATPIISALVCYFALFFLQNVFNQQVYREVHYTLTTPVLEELARKGYDTNALPPLLNQEFHSETRLIGELGKHAKLPYGKLYEIAEYAKVAPVYIDKSKFRFVRKSQMLSTEQLAALKKLEGKSFAYPWMLVDALVEHDPSWRFKARDKLNKIYNMDLQSKLDFVLDTFSVVPENGNGHSGTAASEPPTR